MKTGRNTVVVEVVASFDDEGAVPPYPLSLPNRLGEGSRELVAGGRVERGGVFVRGYKSAKPSLD